MRAFVSHSSADDRYVAEMESFLRAAGFDDVFNDVSAIRPDEKFWPEIEKGIASSDSFVVVITAASNSSEWVKREVEFARNLSKNIIPVLIEDCAIPSAFADRDVIDFRPRSHKERRYDISRIVKYAPAELIGRQDETQLLDDAWGQVLRVETKRPHILTFVALGGERKTSLVAKWAAELAHQDWPGCDAAFAWSFYSQGTREQVAASSDLFLKEAISFFGDDADKAFAASPAGAFEKGQRLARIIGQRRNLLILDGLEPLQYPPTSPTAGELKDAGIAALLKGLATTSHGLCIVTTRYSLPDLRAFRQNTAPEVNLLRLSRTAGVHLLKTLGVNGTAKEFEALVEDVKGHALTLNLLGTYLRDAHSGDIRKRDLVKFEDADAEEQGGHAFRVMDAYVRSLESEDKSGRRALEIWQLLGLFDRPMTADCFKALLKAPRISNLTESVVGMTDAQRNLAFSRLESARLLTVNRDGGGTLISLDAHPLIREYFASKIRQNLSAWCAGHRRLYKHLISTTHEGNEPTLEDLQPLYQAVAHGCQAGLQREAHDEVFIRRILRGTGSGGFYSTKRLGAFGSDLGAVAWFFEIPWRRVCPQLPEGTQASLISVTAYNLRALGRLAEAIEPMRAVLQRDISQKDWKWAAIDANNLSELERTLGEVAGAVGYAEQSVTFADRSDDAFSREATRCGIADALHQAGRRDEAETRFREAEQMQAERETGYRLLYSLQGFIYCDLLLAAPERAAWQEVSRREAVGSGQKAESGGQKLELAERCRVIAERAAQALKWGETGGQGSLLDTALNHLTLGRAALYAAILANSKLETSNSELAQAVAGLRRAGTTHHIPRGLLTRAWLRFLNGARTGSDSAQEDLDEAWEIAERGPMRLFMADIHLYRARLFGGVKDEGGRMTYPWNKNPDGSPRGPIDDLDAAEKLIQECGYHRRDEELADAKEAAKNW